MDDHVLRGMARWPNVPAVYGWLALDRRGQWLLKSDPVGNPVITDFIARNYECDHCGRWFFQNGPQRVFVALEYTPFVFRITSGRGAPLVLVAHTGVKPGPLRAAFMDERGAIVLDAGRGPGVLDDRDLDVFVDALRDAAGQRPDDDALDAAIEAVQGGSDVPLWLETDSGPVKLASILSDDAPRRFGYDPNPTAPEEHPSP